MFHCLSGREVVSRSKSEWIEFTYIFHYFVFSRLYPVIPANARVITERDIQVGGYLIPKNVSVWSRLSGISAKCDWKCNTYLTIKSSHADSYHPVPLCNISGSGRVSKSEWVPAPSLAEQRADSSPVRLCAIWRGKTQLHRSPHRWAGAPPCSRQGEMTRLHLFSLWRLRICP